MFCLFPCLCFTIVKKHSNVNVIVQIPLQYVHQKRNIFIFHLYKPCKLSLVLEKLEIACVDLFSTPNFNVHCVI